MIFGKKEIAQSTYHHHPKPLTLKDIDSDSAKRVGAITQEFTDGFGFLKKCENTVTFFGSARTHPDDKHYKQAKSLAGRIVKELGFGVVTGGGPGIMAAANCGAFEVKGRSLGLTIKLPMEQKTNLCLTDHLDFKYFFSRKVILTFSAEAYVYFPGGYGTLDELFEILTLVQTNKIEHVPVILFGDGYWKDLDKFIKKHLADNGHINKEDTNLYTITSNEDEALRIIQDSPKRQV